MYPPDRPTSMRNPGSSDSDLDPLLSFERLTLRLGDIAKAPGISRRPLERERSAGRFPPPDLHIGKMPLWRPETIRAWIEQGGQP